MSSFIISSMLDFHIIFLPSVFLDGRLFLWVKGCVWEVDATNFLCIVVLDAVYF